MSRLPCRTPIRITLALALALALAVPSCITVRVAAEYDEQIDATATHLGKSMDSFLTNLATLPPGDSARRYAPNREFYNDYGVELRALQVRATSIARNSITVEQTELMGQNLELMRSTHERQDSLSSLAVAQYRDLFRTGWTAILTFELAKKHR